ncbi:E3 ubiquitin-protein ligase SINA-like 7 [Lolium rigidum]|uniref:E3 ubiquitin-protein ligase SINA-like 7 n=1 Tax=Lolium rigidum TaxID=89674 RepID=UPI001F5C9F4E|nr:E3 ubiquitin-protein ligase SINA-like 7 [Lolium rigidum]
MDGSSSNKRTVEALPEVERSTKRLNVSIGVETLDCPICFEPLRPPIFQCSIGHCICSSCRGKQTNKKCHLCSVETSFKRCFGMEHVVQSVIVPCYNAEYGCTEKVTYYQKEEHEKACQNAPCFCPESGCGFDGPIQVLLDHFTTEHKCPLTVVPDSARTSLRLQLGLNVLQFTETSYFFLLSMALEPFGHAISVVCVQPNVIEPKFSCTMDYNCMTTGYCESTSCHIRSSSLSDGLPTEYDLIIPKGKISDDREGIMLTTTIHQPLRLSRSRLRGKDATPALETDDEDNVPLPLSVNRSHLQGNGPESNLPQWFSSDDDDDDDI